MDKAVVERLKALDGITLSEWKKLCCIVNKSFSKKESEFKRSLKLTFDEDVVYEDIDEMQRASGSCSVGRYRPK